MTNEELLRAWMELKDSTKWLGGMKFNYYLDGIESSSRVHTVDCNGKPIAWVPRPHGSNSSFPKEAKPDLNDELTRVGVEMLVSSL